MKQIFLYGIAGVEEQYRVLGYRFLMDENISIENMKRTAATLRIERPSIDKVYAIDNCYGLKHEVMTVLKFPTVENCVLFKMRLEEEGIEITT